MNQDKINTAKKLLFCSIAIVSFCLFLSIISINLEALNLIEVLPVIILSIPLIISLVLLLNLETNKYKQELPKQNKLQKNTENYNPENPTTSFLGKIYLRIEKNNLLKFMFSILIICLLAGIMLNLLFLACNSQGKNPGPCFSLTSFSISLITFLLILILALKAEKQLEKTNT